MQKSRIKGPELAKELFAANYNCAQSALGGILSAKGRAYEDRIKLACAFGAGIVQTGGMCGAITGALMAIGLIIPMKGDIAAWKSEVAVTGRELIARFNKEFGGPNCSYLAGCDMADEGQRKVFHDGGGRENVCAPMVAKSVEIALELLENRK